MKTKLLLAVLLLISNAFYAQDTKRNKETKAEKASRIETEYRATEGMIDSTSFVLRADYLANHYGYRKIVEPTLNFIEVDSSKVIIQTGNNLGIGYNGVGGLTLRGKIVSWRVTKNDLSKSFMISMGISSSLGYYDVFMNISADGRSSARISGTTRGDLIFEGIMGPLNETMTYQGSTI